jgi:hypothetical protein
VRYVPVVAVVAEDVMECLRPILRDSAERIEAQGDLAETMTRNGWTGEMLAIGLLLRLTADEVESLELVEGAE